MRKLGRINGEFDSVYIDDDDDDDDDCVCAKEVSVLLLLCAGGRGRVVDESERFHFLEREPWFKIVRGLKEKRGTFERSERF